MDLYCPFLHIEEIMKHCPRFYFTREDDNIDYGWFLSAPKMSTFRVNTLKYTSEEVLEIIKQQLKNEIQWKDSPSVDIHSFLPDCIVIGCHSENSCEDYVAKCKGDVIVDIPCGNAVLRGADVFAPGILGIHSSAKEGDWVNILADLDKKCLRGFNKHYFGRTYLVGIGILKMDRNDIFKHSIQPKGIGVQVVWNKTGIPKINLPRELGILQNLPSIICGSLFSGISGKVLDMCAAPGNKTTHIASILGNKGHVTALDKSQGKVDCIISLSSDLGLTNISCFAYDSTKCILEKELDEKALTPPFPPGVFSAILLDPPCSALGQRPTLYNSIGPSQLKSYVTLQRKFFKNAVEGLMTGGILVYSTCTITVEENEEMVSWALKNFPNISLQKTSPEVGKPGVPGSLSKEEQVMVSRFGNPKPATPDEDTIGFFIAKFVKKY